MGNFKPARPVKVTKRTKSLPAVTVHVFVPSGSWTSTVVPQEICRECGNVYGHRTHDQRLPEEIFTPVDARKIGEGSVN